MSLKLYIVFSFSLSILGEIYASNTGWLFNIVMLDACKILQFIIEDQEEVQYTAEL